METQRATTPGPLMDFVSTRWPDVKKTRLKQWLKFGAIRVNGTVVTRHDHGLEAGDEVTVRPGKAPPPATALPAGMAVLHQDDDLVVIHKPAGLLSIATDTQRERTAFRVLTLWARDQARSGQARVWVVHRLDRETSGLLVFARTEEAKAKLQESWPEAEKIYLALVEGAPPAPQGTLRGHLDESQPHRVYARGPGGGAREAITHYRAVRAGFGRTLVEVRLETGRRHQIRVQLAEAGCPVVGDELYGAKSDPARRLALHATRLTFKHPRTGQPMTFQSPLPQELARLLPPEV